jgi:hypothetical protein
MTARVLACLVLALSCAWPQSPSSLTITEAVLSQFEDGPAVGPDFEFVQGETVFLRWRLAGYKKAKSEDDRERIQLRWKAEAFDAAGIPVVEPSIRKLDGDLAPQDKNWSPVARCEFVLPPLIDPGTYKAVISVEDELAKSTARRELPIRVRGRRVEPSDTLVVRNFRFLLGEQDGPPLATPAYRPGDQVWARFEMTGYKLGERNRFDIAYGLEVFRGDGKSMYAEPNAARLTEDAFYRKRYAPGVLNLNLQPDIAKGAYTIVLRVRDELGGGNFESRHTFTVE